MTLQSDACGLLDRRIRVQPEIEIPVHRRHQHIHFVFVEMVGAGDFVMVDRNVTLGAQLIDQFLHRARVDHFVVHALNDDAGRRARRKEAKIVHIGGWRDRNKAAHFGAAHQQLHADPCAKAETGDPRRRRFGMEALHPVECGSSIGQFADTVVEFTFTAADAAEVEPQHCKAAGDKCLVKVLRDPVIHRATRLRMWMQDHRHWRTRTGRRRETGFEAAFWTGNSNGRHVRVRF